MKDLRVRCKAALVLLALTTMLGCGALDANKRAQTPATGLVVSNLSLDFGTVVVGSSKVVAENIRNSTPATVTINQVVVRGTGFQLDGAPFPLTLATNQSATFGIRFVPQASGNPSGSLAISSTASAPITVSLAGQSVSAGQLSVNPSPISFGNVLLGSSQTRSATLTNSGGSDLTISQLTVSGSEFQVSGMNLPFTLPASQSTNFNVTFTPKASGNQNGTIWVTTSASLVASSRHRKSNSSAITNVSFRTNAASAAPQDSGGTDPQTVTIPLTGAGAMPGQLSLTPSSVSFGNVQVGSSQTVSETLTNSGSSSVNVSQATVTGAGFSVSGLTLPLSLAAGQNQSFSVTFTPSSAGSAAGNLAIVSDASNPNLNATLSGTGIASSSVTASPLSLNFGSVPVGSSQTLLQTLTNSGSSIVTISQATVTGTGYSVSGLNLPVLLAAGHSTAFNVTFTPSAVGSASGNLSLTSNASNPTMNVPLSAAGVTPGSLTATATSLSFGTVQVGNSQTLSETLTNSGGSSVTISNAAVTGAYSVSGLSLPATLAAGQSTTFNVTFTPTTGGSANGNLSITSNASNPTMAVPLSGTGVTPGSLTATATSLSFGSVQVGNSQTLSETLSNSGGSSVTISSAAVTGAAYSLNGLSLPATLTPGQSTAFNVTFTPTTGGSASGNLAITSNASNPSLGIPLSGTGVTPGSLTATAPSLSFGSVPVNSSQMLSETLTNSGGSILTISQATVTGAGYSVSGLNLPVILAAGRSTAFSVTFTPSAVGSVSGGLTIAVDGSNPTMSVPLSGAGVTPGSLTATAPSLSFGTVQVGNSQTLSETLTNSGGSSVTISNAAVPGAYSVSGLSLPATLAAGQSTTFNVTFTPTTGGSASGNLSITSNASNPSLGIPLSGTGVTPGSLTATISSLSFGSIQVGNSQTLSETLTNSGGSSVTISNATVTGAAYSVSGLSLPATLTPGQSTAFNVTFTPTTGGSANGNLSITSNASNPSLGIPLSGTGVTPGSLTATAPSLSFGSVPVNSSQMLSETLTNSGGSSVTISQATVTGAAYSMSGLTLPATLTPGQSTSFSVTFTPTTGGSASGNLSITSNASNPTMAVPLSGTGVTPGSLTATAPSLSFGSVQVGSSQTLSETLTNSGGSSVTISNAAVTGAYSVSGLSLPATLAAGQSTTFNVTFTPTTGGSASGNLSITSNASNPSLGIPLSGTGVTPGSLTATAPSLSFGSVQVGNSQTLSETLTNSGGSSVTISNATVTGSPYSVSGLSLPATLAAGQSTTFNVTFTPITGGSASGNLSITSNASNPTLAVPLSGTGVTPGSLTAIATTLSFGNVQVGNSQTLSETLTNSGGSNVTISQATLTGAAYSMNGLTLPATLTPGQSTAFSVKFAPTTSGSASGNLSIISNASNPSLGIPLSGTGVTPGSLTATAPSLSFGSVQVGTSQTLSETLTNAGGSNVTISQATVTGAAYSMSGLTLPATLTPGQSTSFSVTFTPTTGGSASGNLSITSNASNPTLAVPLSGTGVTPGSLTATASSLSFGNVLVGNTQTLSETLTNSGGSSLTISQATLTGAAYSMNGLTLPATLTPGQSTTFSVKFAPTTGGSASGNLSITSNASNSSLGIPLSGTGVTPGSLTATATSLSFGSVQVGNSQTLSETLTNSGGSSVTISNATVTGSPYSVSGLSLPATLAAGQSTTFNVTFTPTTGGSASGNLSITSNASNPTLAVPLSGTGVTPGSLTASASSLSFGNVLVGNTQTLSETLTNSGGSSLTISQATLTGAAYSASGLTLPATLTPGQSTTFSVKFAPTASGSASGNLSITSNASNPTLAVPLSGTGVTPGSLTASASSLSFGNVLVGNTQTLSETLTNSGGSSLTISRANVTGAGFSVTGLSLPLTLIPGQSFTFGGVFAPTSAGSVSGNIAVVSNASNPNLAIPLSGTGAVAGQLTVSPATLSFGNVVVGQSKNMTATLSATGSSVTVSSAATGTSEFALSGQSFPFSIAAGNSATITVTFTPQASGTASDTASFTSNAANTPVENLTGNGTAPPQHSVNLTWNASTSSVTGYNIYRSATSGGSYTQINSVLDATTSYTDSTVLAGNTYFYVTTAVDGNGVESGHSNEVKAVIPTP